MPCKHQVDSSSLAAGTNLLSHTAPHRSHAFKIEISRKSVPRGAGRSSPVVVGDDAGEDDGPHPVVVQERPEAGGGLAVADEVLLVEKQQRTRRGRGGVEAAEPGLAASEEEDREHRDLLAPTKKRSASGAIPPQQRPDSNAVTQTVQLRCRYPGRWQECWMAPDEVAESVANRARVDRACAAKGEQWGLGVTSPGTVRHLDDVLGQLRPELRPGEDESVLGELRLTDTEHAAVEVDITKLKPGDLSGAKSQRVHHREDEVIGGASAGTLSPGDSPTTAPCEIYERERSVIKPNASDFKQRRL